MKHTTIPISLSRIGLILLSSFLATVAILAFPNRAQLLSKLYAKQTTRQVVPGKPTLENATTNVTTTSSAMFAPANPGIAPTGDPGQGFQIEGDLQANTPSANTTDWVPGVAGTGVGVLTAAGVPVNPVTTFHPIDLYDNNSDNIFAGGLKADDDPNIWTWVNQKPPAKNDVHNGSVHRSTDNSGNMWFVVAADRASTNGDSYIDFEFLQKGLTANGNGTFSSAGTQGGRTVNDLLVTVAFTGGGATPEYFVQQWMGGQATPSGYDWVDITAPAGTVYMAGNGSTITVPYGAFGSTTYPANAFAEAAVNATALLGNSCLNYATVLIKTKTSQAPSATIKDFIDPIQINYTTAPLANAGPDQTACSVVGSPTNFTVNGTATNGNPAWTVTGTTGTITNGDVTLGTPNAASTSVGVAAGKTGTVTLTLTVNSDRVPPCLPAATDTVVLTVTAGAVAIAPADMTKCQTIGQPTTFTLDGQVTAGSATPLWSFITSTGTITAGDVNIATPSNPTTNVTIAAGKTGTVTIRLTASTTACGINTDDVVLTVAAAPTANAGPDIGACLVFPGSTSFTLNGVVTNGTAGWMYVSSTGTITQADVTIVSPNSATTAVNVGNGKTGTVTLALMTNPSSGACAKAADEVTLTVFDLPTCMISGNNAVCAGSINNTYTASQGASTYAWTISGNGSIVGPTNGTSVTVTAGVAGTYTLMLKVTNSVTECENTCSFPVTVNANPSCNITGATAVCAGSTNNTYSAPAGANLSYSWAVTGNGTIVGSNTGSSINVTAGAAGLYTVNLTVTNTQTGCSSTCVQQVTVNANPTCSITGSLEVCQASTGNTYTGPAGANLSYSWSVTGNGSIVGSTTGQSVSVTAGATGSYTVNLTVRNTQTNCVTSCSQPVTVNPPPTCSISGPDTVCLDPVVPTTYSGPAGANLIYSWSVSGNATISGSTTGQTVSLVNPLIGTFTLTLTVTNTQTGCSSTCTKVVTECEDCGPKGPGLVYPRASEASDQKAGSVLVYNFYTSNATAPNTQNTRINITNTSSTNPVAVHLFFVDGTSCSVADSYLCLTANQTSSFLASDLDPSTSGYLVAVAVDCVLGCPKSFNCLIGDEYIKMASGHVANLAAEAISAVTPIPVACDANSVTATINFDGLKYNRLPRVLALDNVGSRADGNNTLLVVNRIGGNLGIGASTLGSLFGIFYDDAENALSYTFSGACQFRSEISNNFPRMTPRFETFVPAGRTGWTKFWIPDAVTSTTGKGILGAALNTNPNDKTSLGAYSQGHNLHALTLDNTSSYVIPVFPPNCCQ